MLIITNHEIKPKLSNICTRGKTNWKRFQVFRHRENQLQRRTVELEETVAQQNNAILALSPTPGETIWILEKEDFSLKKLINYVPVISRLTYWI